METPEESKPKPIGIDWRDGTLIAAEYRAYSDHYFHEDNYFLRTVGLFATLNVALLTVFGSNLIQNSEIAIHSAILLVGMISTIAWAMSLVRVHYVRKVAENRLAELEVAINEFWKLTDNSPPFPLLKVRNRQLAGNLFQSIPVARIMLLFPFSFGIIWCGLVINLLTRSAPFCIVPPG
jgi:hypothetical protein